MDKSKKIGFAVIGYGGMGSWHASTCADDFKDTAELIGIYDIKPERRAAAEAEGIHAFSSREELLADERIDLVTVATPNDVHKEIAIAAMAAGKNVISEKPVALSQEELYRHYADIAAAVTLPIVMYNIPMRTGCAIEPETVSRLAKDFSNIRGVKDSSGKFENILAYIHGTDSEHFSVLSGNDALILKTLQNGGKGGITAVANILPEMMVSIYQNWKKGDMAAAEAAQQGIQPIRDCFKYGNPNSIVKRAANLIGQPLGPCRKPFGMVSEETDNAILDTIDRYYAAYKR